MRIGHGYDVHAFCEGTEITLCGVSIPHDHGFYAHSDGDVALHALCDALLGAAALGDIGRHFPDTDPKFKNIDSRVLLQQVVSLLSSKHMQCNNADVTIVAQSPRLAPYIPSMADVLARELDIAADRVNVKATTTEQLGFTGRREGISAYAVVTVNESGGQ